MSRSSFYLVFLLLVLSLALWDTAGARSCEVFSVSIDGECEQCPQGEWGNDATGQCECPVWSELIGESCVDNCLAFQVYNGNDACTSACLPWQFVDQTGTCNDFCQPNSYVLPDLTCFQACPPGQMVTSALTCAPLCTGGKVPAISAAGECVLPTPTTTTPGPLTVPQTSTTANPTTVDPYGSLVASLSDYANSLFNCSKKYKKTARCSKSYWFRQPDGACNNLLNSWSGRARTPLKRLLPASYENGVSTPRKFSVLGKPLANPREIATNVHYSADEPKTISHLFAIFGQYVMFDMVKTGHTYEKAGRSKSGQIKECPCNSTSSSCVNIPVPREDSIVIINTPEPSCLVQVRERDSRADFACDLGRREQVNEATAWLDQSTTYGSSAKQAGKLRSYKKGRLEESYDFMPSRCDARDDFKLLVKRGHVCFQTGDERANENPLLAGVHTLFLREHNRLVDALRTVNPGWDDERLYQEARRILNAVYQNIVFQDWLPLVVGKFLHNSFGLASFGARRVRSDYSRDGYFKKYDPNIMPNVAIELAAAAGRFGHALVRSQISRVDDKGASVGNLSISSTLYRPDLLVERGEKSFNQLMRGCLRDVANGNPPHITKDLSDYLVVNHGNRNPTRYHSLPALNINRGREVGLQPYNRYRALAGLNVARSFDELTGIEPDKRERLKRVYASAEDIDLFTGAMSETQVEGGLVGPTFGYILARGFRDLKFGDRFFYENSPQISPYAFTPVQLAAIRSIKMSSVLCATLPDLKQVTRNSFLKLDKKTNPLVSCASVPKLDLAAFKEIKRSYSSSVIIFS